MSFISTYRAKHLEGSGGILELWHIAVPMILSCMFDTLMMCIDRLFLSRVGVVHQAAAMSGGITSWMVTSFFVGVVGYSSTLIAQYLGAGQRHNCVRMVWHALLVGAISYPLILLVDYLVACSPIFDNHSELEQILERRYFWYMGFGSINALCRFAFGSFFSGIGKTKVIMHSNLVALVVNLFANWVLIFGNLGFPAMGLDGAAIGTVMSGAAATAVMAYAFFRARRSAEWYDENAAWCIEWDKLKKLLRYGLPQGIENILVMVGFVFLISSFHSYGEDMATATTIVFNWDSFSYNTLLGFQVAVTTLVGRAMGKGDPALAVKTARSGFKMAITYSLLMIGLFVGYAPYMVQLFAPDVSGLDYSGVRRLAIPMLRSVGIYLTTDAVLTVSIGVLRGAGDTFWTMMLHFFNNGVIASIILCCVFYFEMPPLRVWYYFVILGALSSTTFAMRYRAGRWKKLRIIEN